MDRLAARLHERQSTPVPMRVAASLVYFELQHNAARNDDALDRALNDAAFALAQIADVYHENEARHVLRIPDEALHNGQFEQGPKILPNGRRRSIHKAKHASHRSHVRDGRAAQGEPRNGHSEAGRCIGRGRGEAGVGP